MRRSYILTFGIIIVFNFSIFAQAKPTEIIVKFQPNIDVPSWQKSHLLEESSAIQFKEFISSRFNLAVLSYDAAQISLAQVNKQLQKDIIWVSPNQSKVTSRAMPNDPLYSSQWALTDINVEPFWDITTNGLTYNGDTIVVAVMESGTSVNHPDLVPNFWHNYQEIKDDGIDNDGNGYIDDFFGWNTNTETDEHFYNAHGTKVAGVIGAKADNGLGIAGINWNVKIMPISFVKANFSTYFKAFEYMIDQRKLYNDSDGQKGAFITVVNESFGQDKVFPTDAPNFQQWCEYMSALGEVGILTIGATANSSSVNVDTEGDMPTTCPQEHLIAVTNIGADGILYGGYGVKNIDLAAPGSSIMTTNGEAIFSSFGGTSASTPHVAGAVALIYSYPCERWGNYIQSNPSEAALQVKKWIIKNTKSKFALKDKTVSDGSLNFDGILSDLDFYCAGNRLEPLSLKITPSAAKDLIKFEYDLPEFGDFNIYVFNMLGQQLFTRQMHSDISTTQEDSIDIRFLPAGMYVLMIQQGDKTFVQKFIRT